MNISIVFNAPSLNSSESFSLMKNITNNLEKLSKDRDDIENAEIQLYDTLQDTGLNDKAILISVNCKKEDHVEYGVSKHWDELILHAFNKVRARHYEVEPAF